MKNWKENEMFRKFDQSKDFHVIFDADIIITLYDKPFKNDWHVNTYGFMDYCNPPSLVISQDERTVKHHLDRCLFGAFASITSFAS